MACLSPSAVLHRNLHEEFPRVVRGQGSYLVLDDGRRILDASGGAAVSCIGHGDSRVRQAIAAQLDKIEYAATTFYTTDVCEELCRELLSSTAGEMTRAYIVNSGSEAMEAAMKLARQYFLEKDTPEPSRTRFIARNQSYHGTTLGSLSMGGHASRRAKFEPMLLDNITKVAPCFPYRHQGLGESDEEYVSRLAGELDQEFQRVGPENVCAFVAEPVVGAALGCVPAVSGYFQAMRAVCDKYGALLILDEVMCGIGRTGTMHAWQQEGIVPDIQTIGKCLGGGYQPIAGLLLHKRVVDVFMNGSGAFVHGHTYQGHPIACAAALEVQRIIGKDNLLQNVVDMGALLSKRIHELLSEHPNVGNIRGRGLFWGIELVADKLTKEPFPPSAGVALGLAEFGLKEPYCVAVYPSSGTVDGIKGDHIILSPAYNTTAIEIEDIVARVHRLIHDYFAVSK
ncbi:hypothetical protein SLS62_001179 [Diatrype stigma]|uniref:Aminotransferase n=1 Tax=Diatrype stigma TaxID=117547 RepID=A0AAN9V084_9PEZI